MIECRNLTKRYRGRRAVDAVDLTLAGGINAVLGANGAGKSTLLRLMTGLERPDGGSVTVDGMTMGRLCGRESVCCRISLDCLSRSQCSKISSVSLRSTG